MKKHFKRLIRVYRLQKKLRIKRNKATNQRLDSREKMVAEETMATLTKQPALKRNVFSVLGIIFIGLSIVLVRKIKKQYREKYCAYSDANNKQSVFFEDSDGFKQKSYDEASLEELEEALYKVENEIDEVSAVIENKIK